MAAAVAQRQRVRLAVCRGARAYAWAVRRRSSSCCRTRWAATRSVRRATIRCDERSDPRARWVSTSKYALRPGLTLTATVNPDFGQVEADPAVVNLDAFETFFQERRPFFVEGSGHVPVQRGLQRRAVHRACSTRAASDVRRKALASVNDGEYADGPRSRDHPRCGEADRPRRRILGGRPDAR